MNVNIQLTVNIYKFTFVYFWEWNKCTNIKSINKTKEKPISQKNKLSIKSVFKSPANCQTNIIVFILVVSKLCNIEFKKEKIQFETTFWGNLNLLT